MIKILSGELKGRKLKSLSSDFLRLTQAIVRKSVMDSIRNFDNKNILDLFSGIGTLGIESLSRHAKYVDFVDNNPKVLKILKKNLDMISENNSYKIFKNDALKHLQYTDKTYDMIFADPPYGKFNFYDFLPFIKGRLNLGGVFCYESQKTKINLEPNITIKNYGNTQVTFWRKTD